MANCQNVGQSGNNINLNTGGIPNNPGITAAVLVNLTGYSLSAIGQYAYVTDQQECRGEGFLPG
jgi:hypothetical protein